MLTKLQVTLDHKPLFSPPLALSPGVLEEVRLGVTSKVTGGSTLKVNFSTANAISDHVRYYFQLNMQGQTELADVGQQVFQFRKNTGVTIPVGEPVGDNFDEEVDGSIVLLLESPHYYEVMFDLTPNYPAAGQTGYNLHVYCDYWKAVVEQFVGKPKAGKSVPVFLVNPVPFPASCRIKGIIKDVREPIFRKLLAEKWVKDRLHRRLKRCKPALVINACTSGLRAAVRQEIRAALPARNPMFYTWSKNTIAPAIAAGRLPVVECAHPSWWGQIPPWKV